MIRFLICNILFCGIISILLLMKHILKNCLSSRMQYNLWFLLLGLLTVPFLPSHFFKFSELFFGFTNLKFLPSAATKNASAPPLHNRLSAIYSLDFGYYHYDNISNPICSVPAFIKKICITSWRSGCSKIISTLPKWHKYYKKYTRIQRCLSKISCYCRILETVHLSSRSPDIG